MTKLTDQLLTAPQYILPQHGYSKAVRALTRVQNPLLRRPSMWAFQRAFKLNMSEASDSDARNYASLNALFTRALKPDARPLAAGANTLLCPADAIMSEYGKLDGDSLLQAKGQRYSAAALLGGDQNLAKQFDNGSFATVYLAPSNYHRVHMPLAGQLQRMIHVPGRLFSVNSRTARAVPGLFTRNERVVALFDTRQGPLAVVLVGALGVGHIETVWHGAVEPAVRKQQSTWHYPDIGSDAVQLSAGDELGRFNLGSTVVLLSAAGVDWHEVVAVGEPVVMGSSLGTLQRG